VTFRVFEWKAHSVVGQQLTRGIDERGNVGVVNGYKVLRLSFHVFLCLCCRQMREMRAVAANGARRSVVVWRCADADQHVIGAHFRTSRAETQRKL
jgi:hypothetical protein